MLPPAEVRAGGEPQAGDRFLRTAVVEILLGRVPEHCDAFLVGRFIGGDQEFRHRAIRVGPVGIQKFGRFRAEAGPVLRGQRLQRGVSRRGVPETSVLQQSRGVHDGDGPGRAFLAAFEQIGHPPRAAVPVQHREGLCHLEQRRMDNRHPR